MLKEFAEPNNWATRALLAASFPPFAIVQAEYAPGSTVPAWAAQYVGVCTEWLVNGGIEHMTPCPLPMTLEAPACYVSTGQLRAIENDKGRYHS